MAGFLAGFAQGWQAESDRIEKRKMFEEELKLKRETTLLELAPKYAASRGFTGGSSGSGGGSGGGLQPKSHYEQWLAGMGVSPDKIATISSKGGATALADFKDFIEDGRDKERPWTPEELDAAADSAIVTVIEGGKVDFTDFVGGFGMTMDSLSPDIRARLDLVGTRPTSVQTDFTYQRSKPLGLEDVSRAEQMITSRAVPYLTERLVAAKERMSGDPEGAMASTQEAAMLEEAVTALENENPVKAIKILQEMDPSIVGGIISGVLENEPRVAQVNLGVWEPIKQSILNPQEGTTPSATPQDNHPIGTILMDPNTGEKIRKTPQGTWEPV